MAKILIEQGSLAQSIKYMAVIGAHKNDNGVSEDTDIAFFADDKKGTISLVSSDQAEKGQAKLVIRPKKMEVPPGFPCLISAKSFSKILRNIRKSPYFEIEIDERGRHLKIFPAEYLCDLLQDQTKAPYEVGYELLNNTGHFKFEDAPQSGTAYEISAADITALTRLSDIRKKSTAPKNTNLILRPNGNKCDAYLLADNFVVKQEIFKCATEGEFADTAVLNHAALDVFLNSVKVLKPSKANDSLNIILSDEMVYLIRNDIHANIPLCSTSELANVDALEFKERNSWPSVRPEGLITALEKIDISSDGSHDVVTIRAHELTSITLSVEGNGNQAIETCPLSIPLPELPDREVRIPRKLFLAFAALFKEKIYFSGLFENHGTLRLSNEDGSTAVEFQI